MQRILVIGSGGAGKSTFATQLGERLGLPVVHLDMLYWKVGWEKMPAAEWLTMLTARLAEDCWVMDGNFSGTLTQRLAASDCVVLLDLPRLVCLARIVRRWLRYAGRTRPTMTPGCRERLSWEFFWWVWTYPAKRRPHVLQAMREQPDTTQCIRLRSARDVRAFLASV